MKHGKTTRELLNRIMKTMVIIKDRYAEYQSKVQEPQNDINIIMPSATVRTYIANYMTNLTNFFKVNLFRAALPAEIRNKFAQQDQREMTLTRMTTLSPLNKERAPTQEESLPCVTILIRNRTSQGCHFPTTTQLAKS